MTKLWGGRFEREKMDDKVLEFSSSLEVDAFLARYDCLSSKVHVEALYRAKILSREEKEDLLNVLDKLEEKIEKGTFDPRGHEDIHSAVHAFVKNKLPEGSEKLHTGRSRNEQVVNDVRLYSKDAIRALSEKIVSVQNAFLSSAEKDWEALLPGYTHLNRAQPVLWGHLVLAYVEMLERDRERFEDALKRTDISVMGSGALAGSSFPLDRAFIAERLGFSKVSDNSMDAVSDRDFICEILFVISSVGMHLSRISEDLILYSSSEFAFVELDDACCTGSSLMPQKRNADVLELIRGRSAVLLGSLSGMFSLLKGLPHCYNRDLQDDKRFLKMSVDTLEGMLSMMALAAEGMSVKRSRAESALENEFIYATDIAEHLVRKGVPFEQAHRAVGRMVGHCSGEGINISDLSLAELKEFNAELGDEVFSLLDAQSSVDGKRTLGSTRPENVRERLAFWKRKLGR